MDPRLAGMDPKDVFALFTERMTTLEVMQRTAAKAKRGGELEAWVACLQPSGLRTE